MRRWRTLLDDRLSEPRSVRRRRYGMLTAFIVLLALLSGCAGGGLRHESWPGLTVDEGTIFAANLERVQAFNAETGKLLWSYPDEADKDLRPFYSTPVLAKDYGDHGLLLMAGYKDKTVYALGLGESRAERPDVVWTFAQATGQYVGSGVVADGKYIIGNGDGSVYAINLADGTSAWTFVTQDRVWATPVVVEDTVYIAALDHHLYAVDLTTGEQRWSLEMGGAIAATPVYANGDLWIGDFSATLYQVDLESRSVAWTYAVEDWLWATPLLNDTTLYFADVGGHVYALNVETREMVWSEPAFIEDVLRSRPALNADSSLLYVAGYEKGVIHALDTRNGTEMNWGVVARKPGRLPGDLMSDGDHVYAMPVLVQERIQALEPGTGKVLWQYPVLETE